MRSLHRVAAPICVLAITFACTSTQVGERQEYRGAKLPYPGRILVYDFGVQPSDVPPESSLAGRAEQPSTPHTPEQLALGRKLGEEVARNLAAEIQAMGLPGVRVAADTPPPRPDDLMIRGYFTTLEPGSAVERVAIGFGSGAAELHTYVEAYQMTAQGPRRLGTGTIEAQGAESPGALVPLAVTIATANPIGLAVGGAVKAAEEITGTETIEGSGKRTAVEIAQLLRPKFVEQGWIQE
jgi:hypothetical protein